MSDQQELKRSDVRKGRGAASKPDARFLKETRTAFDDGWQQDEDLPPLRTTVTVERSKTILTHNSSPDIPFEQSVNAYRGCEHGCIYCYARPTHAYMDLSPGLDFESRLFVKQDAPQLLREALAKPGYVCKPLALGTNTDPYQPIEREWKVTRGIIQLLHDCRHPLTLVTKSCLVERDIDLLAAMSERNQVQIFLSVTTLDHVLARKLEPRATAPRRRLECLRRLSAAGVATGVMFAPVIPAINEAELESVIEAAADAGVSHAGYVMMRLPHEVKDLFREWLENHYPQRARHVMSLVNNIRGGRDNDPRFGSRMRGQGAFADLIRHRFQKTCKRLGLNRKRNELDTSLFVPPSADKDQLSLF